MSQVDPYSNCKRLDGSTHTHKYIQTQIFRAFNSSYCRLYPLWDLGSERYLDFLTEVSQHTLSYTSSFALSVPIIGKLLQAKQNENVGDSICCFLYSQTVYYMWMRLKTEQSSFLITMIVMKMINGFK